MPIPLNTQQSTLLQRWAAPLLLVLFAHAAVDTTAQRTVLERIDAEASDHAQGYAWLSWSTEHIGHRLTGSAGGARAEHMADSLFRTMGLDHVERFSFDARAWRRERVQLSVEDEGGITHMESVALANTPEESHVELPLIDGGNGMPEDLEALGSAVRGKAVLVNLGLLDAPAGSSNLHRSEKTSLLVERGAAAVVFMNNVEGHVLLTGTASATGEPVPIPVVCLASEDGTAIRGKLKAGGSPTLRLSMRNHTTEVEANNVIAELRGTELPDEVVLVGGHLDSWDLATGATDNGLGAYSILDMARVLTTLGLRPKRTIRFALFMGEEQGLLGSRALVEHYRNTGVLENVRCMINLDMSSDPRGFGVVGPAGWETLIQEFAGHIHEVDTGFQGEVSTQAWLHSDHQPFLLSGVPVLYPLCDLGKHVYGCYHSSCDDIHLVEASGMVNNARYVSMLLWSLANAPRLPPAFGEMELRDRLIAAGLEEKLRIGGDWRW